jgi:hypothetical protein
MRSWILALVAIAFLASPAAGADAVSQTFAAPAERVWRTTEALLRQFGWGIDKADRSIGWITTDSRGLDGGDYGVYAKGTRHRLRINIRPAGENRTTVSVERMVFKRERILWMDKDEPVQAADQQVERDFLAAIEKSL